MADFQKVEQKWQKKWAESKAFDAIPDKRKKFFLTFPYPYVNGLPHIGHMFTLMRVEAFARYKRLQGYNILFPQGWHCTGSPIVSAARRVAEKEPQQIKILKDLGVAEKDISKFAKPEYWIEYFPPKYKSDVSSLGMTIDWRREFITTSLNPHYDQFIRWQFLKLKEKGYVIKGKFPVVWDPVVNAAVGDHDRKEGEGETPQEFLLVKHKLAEKRFVVTATLRPDTILGITNLFVHPDVMYKETETNKEKWIVSEPILKKFSEQEKSFKVVGDVAGKDLIGKTTTEFDGHKVLILPATFIDAKFGTGMVHSVPSESADDLMALRDLQKNESVLKKYNLKSDDIKKIVPIAVLNTPGYGDLPAQKLVDEYKVNSQNDRDKLEKIKKELYKLSFHTASFNEKYAKGFSKNLSGIKVSEGKEIIKKDLVKSGWADTYYELTGKVVARSLAECIVKIVDNQWFLDYANPEWKKLTHQCLKNMKLYPEKSRQQFEYVVDWLHEWACTREAGLGTRLPWDEKWLIESLSDSTIYMAYYTISHRIKELDPKVLDEKFFDFVFLGKGKAPSKFAQELRDEFLYWYPVDFRNSGKDLVQNHLTFFMFNHVAVFPKEHWPKGIGANGYVMVDGQKMSKSLGNVMLIRDIVKEYSADAARITILNGGEGMDDPNWESSFAKSIRSKLDTLEEFAQEYYNKGRSDRLLIDDWFESQLNELVQKTTSQMEETNFRSSIQNVSFGFQNMFKWYLRRCNNKPHKELMKQAIEAQIVMLSPFTPHICEEIWEKLGKKDFVMNASWPVANVKKINPSLNASEELIRKVSSDVQEVLKLAKIDSPKKLTFIVSPVWKYDLYKLVAKELENTRNPSDILKKVMATDLKKYGQDISKIVPSLINQNISEVSSQDLEKRMLSEAVSYFESEFSTKVVVELADSSKHPKAKNAAPGKPAIVAE